MAADCRAGCCTTIDASDQGGAPLTGEAVLSVRALSVDGAADAAGGVLLDRDGGAVNETVTLVPGRYVCIVASVSGGIPASDAVSFSLGLPFGP